MANARRIAKELKGFEDEPLPEVNVSAVSDFDWDVQIMPPPGTPFEGGVFHWSVKFGASYPFDPPLMSLKTEIYHVNLSRCHQKSPAKRYLPSDVKWAPNIMMRQIFSNIQRIMKTPVLPGEPWYEKEEEEEAEDLLQPFPCTSGVVLTVKTLTGKEIQIEAGPHDSICSVKGKLREIEGVPIPQCLLVFAGKELANRHTLADYNITGEAPLHMVLRLGDIRIVDICSDDILKVYRDNPDTYINNCREWTFRFATPEETKRFTYVTLNSKPEEPSITRCTTLAGTELLAINAAEQLLGDIRKDLAKKLQTDAWLVKLLFESTFLSVHQDGLLLSAAMGECLKEAEAEVDTSIAQQGR